MDLFAFILCLSGMVVDVFGFESSFGDPVMNVTVQEGDVAVLPCSFHDPGDHKVAWTDRRSFVLSLDERRIIDDPRISVERPNIKEWTLRIRNITYSDRGQYVCQLITHSVTTKTVMLIVLIPSKIVNEASSDDQTVREGENVTLICNVTGVPTPDVTWYRLAKGGTDTKERIEATGEVLKFDDVSRYSDGTYECVVYNNVGAAVTRQIKVFVMFAPEIFLPTKRIGQLSGRDTIVDCEITAYPNASMFWKKGERDVDLSNTEKYQVELYSGNEESTRKTLSLMVRNIQQDDFGQYTCYAENMIGNDKESMYLYEYSTITKYKFTTIGPTLTEPTVWIELPDSPSGRVKSNGLHGQENTTVPSTSKAAHDRVTLTSALYVLSLITSILVLF